MASPFVNFKVRSEDRSPSLIPPTGIKLIKQPPVTAAFKHMELEEFKCKSIQSVW